MRVPLCLLALSLSLTPQVCKAWSETIQGVITLAAVDELPAEKRADFLRLVRAHPQFEEMIAPKSDRGTSDREDQIIARAGSWAGRVAGTEHDRPRWRFYPDLFKLYGAWPPEDARPKLQHAPPRRATLETQEMNLLHRHGQLLLVGDRTLFELVEIGGGDARWRGDVREVKDELARSGKLDLSWRSEARLDLEREVDFLLTSSTASKPRPTSSGQCSRSRCSELRGWRPNGSNAEVTSASGLAYTPRPMDCFPGLFAFDSPPHA